MSERLDYRTSYDLRRVTLFGAAASSSLIFFVMFLFFLDAQISSHHYYSTDTISEMMSYAEFFLFAYSSYFAAAVLVWRYADYLAKFSVSWLLISLFGSIAFSVASLLRLWISSSITFEERNPFQPPPPEFWKVAFSMVVFSGVCTLITSIGCGLVSAIVYSDEHKSAVPR